MKNAYLESNFWRHIKCPILIDEKKRCHYCNTLFSYLRSLKCRSLITKNKYIGSTLTPTRRSVLNKIMKKKNIYRNVI